MLRFVPNLFGNGATTLSITTLGITAHSIMRFLRHLIIVAQHNDTQHNSYECCYAECSVFVVILSVIMPDVVTTSVITPSVLAP